MKKALFSIALGLLLTAVSYAGKSVPVTDLPEPVLSTLNEYFPKSTLISAETEKEDGKTVYEVKIKYKDIKLEVETSAEGDILDVEMD
tara:strand:- start:432 stop:695 length:264 start_codon:yes stop_codon:yes gene_type:complete